MLEYPMQGRLFHIKKNISSPEYMKVLVLRTIGNFLLFSSLFLIIKTFYLPVREEIVYLIDKIGQKKYVVLDRVRVQDEGKKLEEIPKGLLAKALNLKPVEYLIPEDPNFSIVIPKIHANARVLSNIDPSEEKTYLEALQKGVAHAAGTAFPGENSHVFLFAHSTDYFWNVGSYNAVFYLLNKLEKGDEVNLFYKGQRYLYRVSGTRVVNPDQVEYLTRKSNSEFLTLQTCWPLGTTLKRLLIFATRVIQ
ncbi:sortase [Candidatus Roizmanbacteria bacterium]|nr:sortase [Candidatus Roizmanbacteria bacterium]